MALLRLRPMGLRGDALAGARPVRRCPELLQVQEQRRRRAHGDPARHALRRPRDDEQRRDQDLHPVGQQQGRPGTVAGAQDYLQEWAGHPRGRRHHQHASLAVRGAGGRSFDGPF